MSAKNRKGRSIAQDRYPTPLALVSSFFAALAAAWRRPLPTSFLEPGSGAAPFCDAARQTFPSIKTTVAVDVRNYRVSSQHEFIKADFLKWRSRRRFDIAITNPPFSLTVEFMRRSVELLKPGGLACVLQRVNFIGAEKRLAFWLHDVRLVHVSVIAPRPSFIKGGNDACEYAWIFYDGNVQDRQPPTASWFRWTKPKAKRKKRNKR